MLLLRQISSNFAMTGWYFRGNSDEDFRGADIIVER